MKSHAVQVVIGVALLICAIAATLFGWMKSDPQNKAGRLRRNLEAVSNEMERRDREIDELTGSWN
jgi:hypothetical protein